MLRQGLVVSVVDLLADLRSTRRQRKLEKHGMQLAEPKPENEVCRHGFRHRRLGEGSKKPNPSAEDASLILVY